jgi:hypothetical protein
MNHPQKSQNPATFSQNAPHQRRPKRMVPTELTGAAFPALYLVRSSWLVRWLARIAFAMLMAVIVGLYFIPWQQSSRGHGRVVARDPQERPQLVFAGYDGIVEWIKPGLQEGSVVEAGELVIRIAPTSPAEINQINNQRSQLVLKKLAYENSRDNAKQSIELQQSSGLATLRSEELAIQSAEAKWELEKNALLEAESLYLPKKNKYESIRELAPRLVSEQAVLEAEADQNAAKQKVDQAKNKVDEAFKLLSSKREAYQSKIQEVEVKNNETKIKLQAELAKLAEVEKEIQELEVKAGQLQRLDVVAPKSGVIQALQVNSGSDAVKKGDDLFTVVPEVTELAVELTIAGNDSPLIKRGDEVRLQFQGWPAIQWVGWPSVAIGTFGGQVNSINPSDDGKGDFVVFVTRGMMDGVQEEWPEDRYLRQGVRANGWVLLRTVPLGYELWRQLNGFPPLVDPPSYKKAAGGDKEDVKKPKLFKD